MPTCHRHYPGRSDGACSLVPLHRQRPSLCNSQVGSCDCCFGACSAFTHVMACTLAGSPSDPFHRKLRQLRCLRRRFDCYRVERTSSRAGVAPAEVQRLSRRTVSPTRPSIIQLESPIFLKEFPSGMQQWKPPHCESGSQLASNWHLNVKQSVGLPDRCSTVHPDNFLHFQLRQDSLGSTHSQADHHR